MTKQTGANYFFSSETTFFFFFFFFFFIQKEDLSVSTLELTAPNVLLQ
jgi:hypothetical protein